MEIDQETKALINSALFNSTSILYQKVTRDKMNISDNTIKKIHNRYLYYVFDIYQAQPATQDEWMRYTFVTEMIMANPLFVDGDMLWTNLPYYASESETEKVEYETSVLTPIREVYNNVSSLHAMRSLNVPRVLMKIQHYFIINKFKDCLDWLEKLGIYPDIPEEIVESIEKN